MPNTKPDTELEAMAIMGDLIDAAGRRVLNPLEQQLFRAHVDGDAEAVSSLVAVYLQRQASLDRAKEVELPRQPIEVITGGRQCFKTTAAIDWLKAGRINPDDGKTNTRVLIVRNLDVAKYMRRDHGLHERELTSVKQVQNGILRGRSYLEHGIDDATNLLADALHLPTAPGLVVIDQP